jgi:Uncharacterized conserved protein (DUF2075)
MNDETPPPDEARRGWASDFDRFAATPATAVVSRLKTFISDASLQQIRAWNESIPMLQQEIGEVREVRERAAHYSALLEYQLPLESRRTDAILLLSDAVIVIELKGKTHPSDADVDQAHAYARDLRCYHAECETRPVHAVLVPTRARGNLGEVRGVHVCGPDVLDRVLEQLDEGREGLLVDRTRFLSADAYRPLPTLVRAARELFTLGTLRRVKRAASVTDGAVEALSRIVHDGARTKTRRLALITGVPGAGKTLVGLRLVHAHFIDDLAVPRAGGKATVPAVFLSGNGPLVEVLQYELREAGGGGRTFVRGVKDYVARYERAPELVPPEHVLVFDEAQRAYDAAMVTEKHRLSELGKSEPEHFVDFAGRVPEWCIVVGLIGSGQEIHKGEEGGLIQWAQAIKTCKAPGEWTIHGPSSLIEIFSGLEYEADDKLNLTQSLRSHLSFRLHEYVAGIVRHRPADASKQWQLADQIAREGHDLRISRDRTIGEAYLHERYADDADARFGIVASSRDRDLVKFGVKNDFQSTKRVRYGPWYGDEEASQSGRSCRLMRDCVTEFGAQGLELDSALLAWGTDFLLKGGEWNIDKMAKYQRRGAPVRDAWQLRANAYRVLLTRARDATVVFVPPLPELDETYEYLVAAGFRVLGTG